MDEDAGRDALAVSESEADEEDRVEDFIAESSRVFVNEDGSDANAEEEIFEDDRLCSFDNSDDAGSPKPLDTKLETFTDGGGVPALECTGEPRSRIEEAGVVRRELVRDICSKIVTGPGSAEDKDVASANELVGIPVAVSGAKLGTLELRPTVPAPLVLLLSTALLEAFKIMLSTGLAVDWCALF